MNFVLLTTDPDPSVFEQVRDFISLITRQEFVSLTFNTVYFDYLNRKIIFRPRMLPCYSYEFDFIDDSIMACKKELAEISQDLGFLTLKKLRLDAVDYEIDNGKYHAALDKTDKMVDEALDSSL